MRRAVGDVARRREGVVLEFEFGGMAAPAAAEGGWFKFCCCGLEVARGPRVK